MKNAQVMVDNDNPDRVRLPYGEQGKDGTRHLGGSRVEGVEVVVKRVEEAARGEFEGKVCDVFTSARGLHLEAETTVITLNQIIMIHGMVVQIAPGRNHYSAASMIVPNYQDKETCRNLGVRVA